MIERLLPALALACTLSTCQRLDEPLAPAAGDRPPGAVPDLPPERPPVAVPAGPVMVVDPLPADPYAYEARPPDPPTGLDCFAPAIDTPVDEWISNLRADDLDGDGETDVVLLYSRIQPDNSFRSYLQVMRGDGRGGFHPVQEIDAGDMVLDVAIADLDEDGRKDLAWTDFRPGTLVVYGNRGDARFAPLSRAAAHRRAGELRAADLDRDGHLDLVVTIEKGALQLFRGDGRGGLRAAGDLPVEAAPERPVIADLDGDGALDLAVLNNDAHSLIALLGRGDGRFARAARVDVCDSPTSLAAGDFDLDGAPDLAFSCLGDPELQVLLNRDGSRRWLAHRFAGRPIERIAVGDLDHDGPIDVITFAQIRREELPADHHLGGRINLFAGDGAGGFRVRSTAVEQAHLGDPAVADIDHDGRNDLVASRWQGRRPGSVSVWFGRACD